MVILQNSSTASETNNDSARNSLRHARLSFIGCGVMAEAIIAGLLPILWSTGAGSEIMQRIAVPMIGGMVSSTLLTLVVIPAIYGLTKGRGLLKEDAVASAPTAEA